MQEFSDINLKKDISELGTTLEDVIQFVGKYYKWKTNSPQFSLEKPNEKFIGLIAQDVEEIFPDLVSTYKIGDEEYLKVDYTGLSIMLLESIKEINEMLNEQKEINDNFLQLFNDQKVINQTLMANMQLINTQVALAGPSTQGVSAIYTDPNNISPNITNIEPPE